MVMDTNGQAMMDYSLDPNQPSLSPGLMERDVVAQALKEASLFMGNK